VTVTVGAGSLTIADVDAVARQGARVALDPAAVDGSSTAARSSSASAKAARPSTASPPGWAS